MNNDEAKSFVDSVKDLGSDYAETAKSLKDTTNEVLATRKLWKEGSKSTLIKVGVALVAFPEPIVSDALGTFLIAAGAVQIGLQRRTLHVGDVYKTFQSTMKDLRKIKLEI